jgi:AcrR family transcriptional regulator
MSRTARAEAEVKLAGASATGQLERSRDQRRIAAAECAREWPVSSVSAADPAADEQLQKDLVREVQRMWILSAVAKLAREKGPESLTVREIIARAGVSRRRFYELFESSRDCFEAAFEEALTKATEQVLTASEGRGDWVQRLRSGLLALLSFIDAEPELARLCVLGATTVRPAMLARRRDTLAEAAIFFEEGRVSVPVELQPPPLTAESLVGGTLSVIQARMLEPEAAPLVELLNPLVSVIVLAYKGPAQARRELSRPMPRGEASTAAHDARNSVALDMRLTYRTLRVLAVIGTNPGISNRAVGEAAGIANAGQISKMLARLERHGLIRNTGAGQPKGAPNAWKLTPVGMKIDRARRLARGGSQAGEG